MSKSNFEVRVVETRYGRRLLIRVGGERVWLGEREVRELLSSTREAIVGEHDTSLDKF